MATTEPTSGGDPAMARRLGPANDHVLDPAIIAAAMIKQNTSGLVGAPATTSSPLPASQPHPTQRPSPMPLPPQPLAFPTPTPPPASVSPIVQLSVHLFDPAQHAHLVLYLAALHGSCITHDGLAGSFVPPLHHDKLLAWWKSRLGLSSSSSSSSSYSPSASPSPSQVQLLLLFARQPPLLPGDNGAAMSKITGPDLVGAAMLRNHEAESSPHVATLELLLVGSRFRRQGGARLLMHNAKLHALLQKRTLLTAEVEAESVGEIVLKRLGFIEAGRIPGFVAVRPGLSGKSGDQVILYIRPGLA